MNNLAAPDEIPFTLRESKRATRIRLLVSKGGLEVVVPAGTPKGVAEKFIKANRDWVVRTLIKVCGGVPTPPQDTYADLPLLAHINKPAPAPQVDSVSLRALGKNIEIRYVQIPMLPGRVTLLPSPPGTLKTLTIYCANSDAPPRKAVADALRGWLRNEAKAFLPGYVYSLSDELGIRRPTQIRIGFQRTIWGSRSTSGRISLNAPLLFLPPHLLRHVVVHELCHTVHMNHGKRFHELLEKFNPAAERNSAELHHAGSHVPDWVRGK